MVAAHSCPILILMYCDFLLNAHFKSSYGSAVKQVLRSIMPLDIGRLTTLDGGGYVPDPLAYRVFLGHGVLLAAT